MEKREIIIGRIALVLMLVSVLVTGCGSTSYSDVYDTAAEYASGAADTASKAMDSFADNAGRIYDEAADSAEAIYEDFEEAASYEAPSYEEAEAVEAYDGDYEGGYNTSASPEEGETGVKKTADTSDKVVLDSEKIVYYADINMSSKNCETARKQIKDAAEKYGALIQEENYYENDISWYTSDSERGGRRNYYVELRVPSDNYNALISEAGNMDAVVNNVNTSAQNITRQYYDTQAEIDSLEDEMKQLKAIMKEAKKVEDVLYIQDRITEIQTRINSDKSQISRMNTDIAYSYVNITLQEVMIYKEPEPEPDMTYEQKLMRNFYNSLVEFEEFCYDFVLYFVRNWIKILAAILILIIIISIFRGGRSKREIRREVKRQYKEKKREEKRLRKEEKKA